jgi:general secretion pathway protein B
MPIQPPPPPLTAEAIRPVAPPPKSTASAAAAPVAAAEPNLQTPAAPPTQAALLSALPEDIRRQIPPLSISGVVYSADPTQRLLLVNGLVLNEGSQVAPDLSVVEIRSNSAEFNFKGTRFRVMR